MKSEKYSINPGVFEMCEKFEKSETFENTREIFAKFEKILLVQKCEKSLRNAKKVQEISRNVKNQKLRSRADRTLALFF